VRAFDGSPEYDFQGKPSRTYALLADASLHVNAKFKAGPRWGSSFLGTVGVTGAAGDRVAIAECGYSCMDVTVNGEPLDADNADGVTLAASGLHVALTDDGFSPTATVRHGTYTLSVVSPPQDLLWKAGAEDAPHVDLAVRLRSPPVAPHGVLGRSAAHLVPAAAAAADGDDLKAAATRVATEGTKRDFQTGGLWDPVFRFQRFFPGDAAAAAGAAVAAASRAAVAAAGAGVPPAAAAASGGRRALLVVADEEAPPLAVASLRSSRRV